MNLVQNSGLVEQLAASYALGTLRGGARRRFEALARTHATIRASALVWQGRLASVAELQPQAAPSAAVWKRIENLVNAERQAKAMAAARAPVVAAAPGWWASLNLWRGASVAGVAAAVLAVVVGVNSKVEVAGQLASLSTQVKDLSAKLAIAPEIKYVAVLADDKADASMLVTFDPKSQKITLKRVGNFREQADKSLQLWAIPQSGGPKSLGVLGTDAVIRLAATGNDVQQVPVLAISLEAKGGAPAGSGPAGPVLFKGALLETAL